MAIDNDPPTSDTSNDSCSILRSNRWPTDFGSFLDDVPSSEFSDQRNMSKTNEFDAIPNMPSDSTNGVSDMSYFNPSSSVADACYELPHEDFDPHTRYRNTNGPSCFDPWGGGLTPSQTNSMNFQQNFIASDLDMTTKQTLTQACVVRQDDGPNTSRMVITIDDAESATVMGVMKMLIDSKAKVNFQSA